MAHGSATQRAIIAWEGDSLDVLKSWPASIRTDFGNSIGEMQDGREPRLDVRPMQSVGPGVFELKNADAAIWYRVMYLARIGNTIHILHCFAKKTRKTERNDLNTAKARLSKVMARNLQEKRDEKKKRGK